MTKITTETVVTLKLDGDDFDALYNVLGQHSISSHEEAGAEHDDINRVTAIWQAMHEARGN